MRPPVTGGKTARTPKSTTCALGPNSSVHRGPRALTFGIGPSSHRQILIIPVADTSGATDLPVSEGAYWAFSSHLRCRYIGALRNKKVGTCPHDRRFHRLCMKCGRLCTLALRRSPMPISGASRCSRLGCAGCAFLATSSQIEDCCEDPINGMRTQYARVENRFGAGEIIQLSSAELAFKRHCPLCNRRSVRYRASVAGGS